MKKSFKHCIQSFNLLLIWKNNLCDGSFHIKDIKLPKNMLLSRALQQFDIASENTIHINHY